MLIRLFSVFIVCFFVAGANAQLVQDSGKQSFERVYLLIDSSGSMKDVHSILQEEVSDHLAQARSLYPTAQIYTSFFGADTATECFAAPNLARLDDTSGALVVPRDGYKQSTPLGEALKAAITDAHGYSAKIILFSDEQQTPQCGIDVCAVAASYLPKEGLRIESIAIGADVQDRDRLGCIFGAQFSGAWGGDAEASDQTASGIAETNTRKQKKGWDEYRLIEQLPFIIGLALILSSAFFFQIYYGDRAVHVEKQIGELSEELPNPYPEDDIEPKKLEDESKSLLQRADLRLAGVGIFILLAVVFWPRNAPYFADYFIRARSVSWLVVNSTFFTGVAILGIAPLLLAGA